MTPTPLGYLTENSLSLYPFKDNCSLASSRSPFERLGNDVFLDFQFSTNNPSAKRVCLSILEYTYEGQNPLNVRYFTFKYRVADENSALVTIITQVILADTVTDRGLFHTQLTENGYTYAIKIIVGAGLVKLHTDGVIKSFDFDSNFFQIPAAEFLGSCVMLAHPIVTSITYDNVDKNNQPIPGNAYVHTGNSKIEARYNCNIENNNIDILRGAGAGLYDICPERNAIVQINGVGADANGNINLIGDQCYNRVDEVGKVTFDHTCNARCTESHIAAYVYYTNRLKDAMAQLLEYASTGVDSVQANLVNAINTYRERITLLQQSVAPYIEVQSAKTKNALKQYFSFAIGIYDPQKTDLLVNFKATPMTIPDGTKDWKYVDETAFLEETNNTYPLPFHETDKTTWKFIDRSINCRGSAAVRFVLSTEYVFVDGHIEFYLSGSTTVTRPSTAYKMHVLNPDGYYYTMKAKRVWNATTSKYRYTFYVDFFKASLNNSSPSASTTFSITGISGSLAYVASSAKLAINNGTATPTAGTASNPNISAISINYGQKATLVFEADYTPSGDDHTAQFSLTGTMTVGADVFTKVMTVR